MRLVVCDDHEMFTEAMGLALGRLGHEVVGTANHLDEVPALVEDTQPELCILDLWFESESALEVAHRLRIGHPSLRIVLLTADASPEAVTALDCGDIDAIAGKEWTISLIDQTLARVASGRPVRRLVGVGRDSTVGTAPLLTAREQQVLDLLAAGSSTLEITLRLGVSDHTVRSHVRNVLAKLGAHSRVEALRVARDRALLPSNDVARG
jgi:two-component system nitrate/nitrite response regulator NarL